MEITSEIKAQVYRELADDIDNAYLNADALRRMADKHDPPKSDSGLIVFEDGTKGMILKDSPLSVDKDKNIVTEYGELLEFGEEIPWTRARIVEPYEVTITKTNAEELVRILYEDGRPLTAEVLESIIRQQEKSK